jgi:hypothetical protein
MGRGGEGLFANMIDVWNFHNHLEQGVSKKSKFIHYARWKIVSNGLGQ